MTERTNNVTNAYTFFNLTSGFEFSELKGRMKKVERQLASFNGDIDTMTSLNRSIFTLEQQQTLIKSTLDLIDHKVDRTIGDVESLMSSGPSTVESDEHYILYI